MAKIVALSWGTSGAATVRVQGKQPQLNRALLRSEWTRHEVSVTQKSPCSTSHVLPLVCVQRVVIFWPRSSWTGMVKRFERNAAVLERKVACASSEAEARIKQAAKRAKERDQMNTEGVLPL